MATNVFNFDPKTGNMKAVSNVRATGQHECDCGARFSFELDWPENLTVNGPVTINGPHCPQCSKQVALPAAHYWVEDFQLLSKPLP